MSALHVCIDECMYVLMHAYIYTLTPNRPIMCSKTAASKTSSFCIILCKVGRRRRLA